MILKTKISRGQNNIINKNKENLNYVYRLHNKDRLTIKKEDFLIELKQDYLSE